MTDYATHPDWLALLRGVCEDPADDLPRLVAADWLEDNGHGDRGELIRVQVELGSMHWAKGGGVCLVPGFALPLELRRLVALQRRERELEPPCRVTIREFPTAFSVSADPAAGMHGLPHATLTRGFVASVRLTRADFLTHAAALFSRHPVTAVTLSDRQPFDAPGHPASYDWVEERAGNPAAALDRRDVLPEELFRRLPTPDADWGGRHAAYFDADGSGRSRAIAALSAACVGYGRELAGLPAPREAVPA